MIVDINKEAIEEYLISIKEIEKLNPNTINSIIRHLKAFYSYLLENGTITINPMSKIKKLRIDEEPLKPFLDRQILTLLNQPDKSTFVGYRDYIIMSLLLGTGIRISELVNIRYTDIDSHEGSILITQAKSRKPRIVGIPKAIKSEIKMFFQVCFDDIAEEDYIFQNIDGNKICIRTVQERITQYGITAKISGVR